MTIEAMKNIGTRPSDLAGTGCFATRGACARLRSTFDKASAVNSSTTPDITNGRRGS